MKINKKITSSKKRILIIALAVALVASGVYSVYAYKNGTVRPSVDENTSTTDEKKTTSQKEASDREQDDPIDKTQPRYSDKPAGVIDSEQGKRRVQMTASHNIGGDTVYIRGGINNAVLTDGECSASFTGPNGQVIVKPTQLLQNAATTDCKTIKVDMQTLAKGLWRYKLNYISETIAGASNEDSFEVK